MSGASALLADDRILLAKLNGLAVHHSFDPELDVDWAAETTDEEFLALYDAWSLLLGTGKDAGFDAPMRVDFARYQQANLMLFTALLERYGLRMLEELYEREDDLLMVEALGHFVKEETFHHTMFMRAVAKFEDAMPGRPKLPRRHIRFFFRWVFMLIAFIPTWRLRMSVGFLLLEFAEHISIIAHTASTRAVTRGESFAPRIWALHALDEARHLRFDAFIRRRYRAAPPLACVVKIVAAPLVILSSVLLNANDVWAARQVGARVSWWHLPLLMHTTTAPFKRSVFSNMKRLTGESA